MRRQGSAQPLRFCSDSTPSDRATDTYQLEPNITTDGHFHAAPDLKFRNVCGLVHCARIKFMVSTASQRDYHKDPLYLGAHPPTRHYR